jgi:VPS inhibitor protein E
MPLKQTRALIQKYGESIKNGTISDEMLDSLSGQDVFKRSPGTSYIDPHAPLSESNYSQMDGIKDFVQTIGEELKPEVLHELTARIIERAPDRGANTFMRNSTLEKALLAYELCKHAELAEGHFDSPRIKSALSGKNDIVNLKTIILNPIIDTFKPSVNYLAAKKQLELLLAADPLSPKSMQAQKVINQIDKLKKEGKEPIADLTEYLKDTSALLNNSMTADAYKAKGQKVQGNPSAGMKFLGGLMIALGVIAAAACVALASVGFVLPGEAVASAGVIAAGIGIFSGGMRAGLSKSMNQLAETNEKDDTPKPS